MKENRLRDNWVRINYDRNTISPVIVSVSKFLDYKIIYNFSRKICFIILTSYTLATHVIHQTFDYRILF